MRFSNLITESIDGVIGPFKVLGYDPVIGLIKVQGAPDLILDNKEEVPKPGRNYAFKLSAGNHVSGIVSLTVDTIIRTASEVLLIKRGNDPFKGMWALPGGFIDPGEKPIDAARRELREETGLEIIDISFIGKYDKLGRDPRMKNVWSFAFLATIPHKESVQGLDDAVDAQWIPLNQLYNMKLAFDHMQILADAL